MVTVTTQIVQAPDIAVIRGISRYQLQIPAGTVIISYFFIFRHSSNYIRYNCISSNDKN